MTKLISKITTVRNWAGKMVLWGIGIFLIISQSYGYLLEGFFLTDIIMPDPGTKFFSLTGFGLVLMIGGWRLNAIIDKFLNIKNPKQ